MIKLIFVYVSLFVLSMLGYVRADEEMPEGVSVEGEGDNQVIKLSKEKAKREGWLPWEEWYDTTEYDEFK
jgi:hypothetical protein